MKFYEFVAAVKMAVIDKRMRAFPEFETNLVDRAAWYLNGRNVRVALFLNAAVRVTTHQLGMRDETPFTQEPMNEETIERVASLIVALESPAPK